MGVAVRVMLFPVSVPPGLGDIDTKSMLPTLVLFTDTLPIVLICPFSEPELYCIHNVPAKPVPSALEDKGHWKFRLSS